MKKYAEDLGKPDIIYVKNFSTIAEHRWKKKPENADEIHRSRKIVLQEVGKGYFKKSENELQEVRKSNFKKSEKHTSGSSEIEPSRSRRIEPLIILTIIRLI